MKRTNQKTSIQKNIHRSLLHALRSNLLSLKRFSATGDLLEAYEQLIEYLEKLTDADLTKVYAAGTKKVQSKANDPQLSLLPEQLLGMDAEKLESMINNPTMGRKQLDQLARVRFGLTVGELSSLSNRSQLVRRLQSLVDNERTHHVIGRVVKNSVSGRN